MEDSEVVLDRLTSDMVTEAYVGWLNDPEVNQYLESRFQKHTLASTRQFVDSCSADSNALLFGIFLQSEGRKVHVGNLKLQPINRIHGFAEVGILVGDKRFWGKGIGTKALNQACDIAKSLGLRNLTAGCYGQNKGSFKIFIKSGFEVVGQKANYFNCEYGFDSMILFQKAIS